jgi:hypothetical protein
MLEREAKTKWCPYVPRDPRDNSVASGQCCIGSDCMGWDAWANKQLVDVYNGRNAIPESSGWSRDPDQSGVPLNKVRLIHEPVGTCGMKPKEITQ